MDLRFANPRRLRLGDDDPTWSAYRAAVRKSSVTEPAARAVLVEDLSPLDRDQLRAAVAAVYGAEDLDLDTFLAGEADEETDESRHMPIEWWDVIGPDEAVAYQLWLCHSDCGTLFIGGGVEEAGYVSQFHLHDVGADVVAALRVAQAVVEAEFPGAELNLFRL